MWEYTEIVSIAPFKSDYEILELATSDQRIGFAFHRRPVSSVGKASDYCAGGRGFRLLYLQCYMVIAGEVKEPTHPSQRVGNVVPGVVSKIGA